ncbi:UDP-galactose transporter [Sphaceloma murrayae]|uniref:UDP-galactose transporter n=1 Tax=Sphaceloma murrayae TaxID=2082308 RepID=A0A2K1QX63_9PEZI|nr:UDP-galactose transporter [Sphaceloma murrayae]
MASLGSVAVKAVRVIHKVLAPSLYGNPALLAAIAFVIIQVGIGIIFKIAQRDDGRYAFSLSSSIAISEFCKLILSTIFFYRQCQQRQADPRRQSAEKHTYAQLDQKSSDGDERSDRSTRSTDISDIESAGTIDVEDARPKWKPPVQQSRHIGIDAFIAMVLDEIQIHTAYGMAHLALLYAIINNSTFVLYQLADPGTISLVRSGITLITALNLLITTGQKIYKRQWIAILFQICGVLVTQYNPEHGSLYPFATYLLLIFQTTISASAGVYNQTLLKGESGSLHVTNMSLYAAGTIINISIHLVSRVVDPSEPLFFQGYGSWGAFMVVLSNVFIGLAITAVYKYADALIKCFATAVSTGILLYVAPMIFHVPLSFLTIPGTVTVFAATYLYLDGKPSSPPPKVEPSLSDKAWMTAPMPSPHSGSSSIFQRAKRWLSEIGPRGERRQVGLATTFPITIALILALVNYKAHHTGTPSKVPVVESPLKDSLAFVRWNAPHPERIPTIMKYKPYFADIHISMPDYLRQTNRSECTSPFDQQCGMDLFNDIHADNYGGTMQIYTSVARTMQLILDAPDNSSVSKMNGLFYFHFDAWIDPMGFSTENIEKIWFPDGENPRFECMTNTSDYNHWTFGGNDPQSYRATNATADVVKHLVNSGLRSRINQREWCVGWADIYYIPRRYFKDYISLSRVFFAHDVMHEVAIPTMIRIIDLMRRSNVMNTHEVLTHLSDCWGSCCSDDPHGTDLLWHRCGHRLDFSNKKLANVFFDKIDRNADVLGTPLYDETSGTPLKEAETIFDPQAASALLSKQFSIDNWLAARHKHGKEDDLF